MSGEILRCCGPWHATAWGTVCDLEVKRFLCWFCENYFVFFYVGHDAHGDALGMINQVVLALTCLILLRLTRQSLPPVLSTWLRYDVHYLYRFFLMRSWPHPAVLFLSLQISTWDHMQCKLSWRLLMICSCCVGRGPS